MGLPLQATQEVCSVPRNSVADPARFYSILLKKLYLHSPPLSTRIKIKEHSKYLWEMANKWVVKSGDCSAAESRMQKLAMGRNEVRTTKPSIVQHLDALQKADD